jgi:arylsulfate sulfotransferase
MTVHRNRHHPSARPTFYFIQNAIYDEQGYIRWYSELFGFRFFPLADNLMAIQLYNDKGDPVPTEEDIAVMDLLGKVHAQYDVPNRAHHEIIEKNAGGNLLVGTNAEAYLSIENDTEDALTEIDRHTGDTVRFWDLGKLFDPLRPRLWEERPNDWCHLNSIEYDNRDQSLLISSKLQYFIAKIDYSDHRIKWIFGNHENWKEKWQKYLLTPLNFDTGVHPDRDWTYAQHMARMTEEGTVIVYDNGKLRPGGEFCRILEFRVDTLAMTVEKIWTYDFDFETRTQGSVHILSNGHILVGHGEIGKLTELSREGEVVFDARLSVFYRAYPFDIYPLTASNIQ